MTHSLPTVYLPIESKGRELASRILLARMLVARGFTVVLGYGQTVVAGGSFWPKGLFLLKGLNAVQKKAAEVLTTFGHAISVIDEEALGIADPWFLCKDVDRDVAPLISTVFCQGALQSTALREGRGFRPEQLVVTGNPRIDLLRPPLIQEIESRAEDIRQKHGRFLLVNTNSGSINNLWGDLRQYFSLLAEIGWYDPKNSDDRALVDDHIEHDRNNYRALREMIDLLVSQRPDIGIIVRPHPSERSRTWETFAKDKPSVRIVSQTEAAPWLLAAEVVVSTGCTTGLEAFVLGKPTISLIDQPDHIRHPSFFVANRVSTIARSPREVVDHVQDLWAGQSKFPTQDIERRQHALALHVDLDARILASTKIADAMAARFQNSNAFPAPTNAPLDIHPALERRLRQVVKKVSWKKAAFERSEVDAWIDSFDHLLDEPVPMEIRDLSWSTYEFRPPRST